MSYINNMVGFLADFREAQTLAAQRWQQQIPNGRYRRVDPGSVWHLYENTCNAPLGFQVFGRHIKYDWPDGRLVRAADMNALAIMENGQLPPRYIGISQAELDNFGPSGQADSGSVLWTDLWTPTVNDTWLSAGIHSRHHFHPASPLTYWNAFDARFVLTVTGRELVGLAMAGYTPVRQRATGGTIFIPNNTMTIGQNFNLPDYQRAVSRLNTPVMAQWFLRERGIDIR